MNLYIFELILKFIRMLFIAFISFFNISLYSENVSINQNSILNQDKYAVRTLTIRPAVQEPIGTKVASSLGIESFVGRLTGYGPDCAGCSKVGNVACKTREKTIHSLTSNGIYYNDSEYGKVRILAAATTKFRCGTVIQVEKPGVTPFLGIVLDTGGTMSKEWSQGRVWIDLAYQSESVAGKDNLTGKNIKFVVQRYGW